MLQGAFDNCQLPRMLPLLKNGKTVNNVRLDVLVFSRLDFNVFIINVDERLEPNSFWNYFGNFHPQNYDSRVAQYAIVGQRPQSDDAPCFSGISEIISRFGDSHGSVAKNRGYRPNG